MPVAPLMSITSLASLSAVPPKAAIAVPAAAAARPTGPSLLTIPPRVFCSGPPTCPKLSTSAFRFCMLLLVLLMAPSPTVLNLRMKSSIVAIVAPYALSARYFCTALIVGSVIPTPPFCFEYP